MLAISASRPYLLLLYSFPASDLNGVSVGPMGPISLMGPIGPTETLPPASHACNFRKPPLPITLVFIPGFRSEWRLRWSYGTHKSYGSHRTNGDATAGLPCLQFPQAALTYYSCIHCRLQI